MGLMVVERIPKTFVGNIQQICYDLLYILRLSMPIKNGSNGYRRNAGSLRDHHGFDLSLIKQGFDFMKVYFFSPLNHQTIIVHILRRIVLIVKNNYSVAKIIFRSLHKWYKQSGANKIYNFKVLSNSEITWGVSEFISELLGISPKHSQVSND